MLNSVFPYASTIGIQCLCSFPSLLQLVSAIKGLTKPALKTRTYIVAHFTERGQSFSIVSASWLLYVSIPSPCAGGQTYCSCRVRWTRSRNSVVKEPVGLRHRSGRRLLYQSTRFVSCRQAPFGTFFSALKPLGFFVSSGRTAWVPPPDQSSRFRFPRQVPFALFFSLSVSGTLRIRWGFAVQCSLSDCKPLVNSRNHSVFSRGAVFIRLFSFALRNRLSPADKSKISGSWNRGQSLKSLRILAK